MKALFIVINSRSLFSLFYLFVSIEFIGAQMISSSQEKKQEKKVEVSKEFSKKSTQEPTQVKHQIDLNNLKNHSKIISHYKSNEKLIKKSFEEIYKERKHRMTIPYEKYKCTGFTNQISEYTCSGIKLAMKYGSCEKVKFPTAYVDQVCFVTLHALQHNDCSIFEGLDNVFSYNLCMGISHGVYGDQFSCQRLLKNYSQFIAGQVCEGISLGLSNQCHQLTQINHQKAPFKKSIRQSRQAHTFDYYTQESCQAIHQLKEKDLKLIQKLMVKNLAIESSSIKIEDQLSSKKPCH